MARKTAANALVIGTADRLHAPCTGRSYGGIPRATDGPPIRFFPQTASGTREYSGLGQSFTERHMAGRADVPDILKAAPIDNGCCIRIEGRGTMSQSRTALDLAQRTFAECPQGRVVFDLTACTYLDSTFFGCLLTLYRDHGRCSPPRFFLAAPLPHRTELLGLTKLDQIIPALETPPPITGQWVTVESVSTDPRELAEHVMDRPRKLSHIEGPMASAFAKIADQRQRELAA